VGQERFLNFSLLNIESDITAKRKSEIILNQFDSASSRALMFG